MGTPIGAFGVVIGIAAATSRQAPSARSITMLSAFPCCSSTSAGRRAGRGDLTLVAAAAGAFIGVRRAVRVLPPAKRCVLRRSRCVERSSKRRSSRAGSAWPGSWCCETSARHPLRGGNLRFGIGFAVAILVIGLVFNDAVERLIATQFWIAERQDVTVNFVEPRSADAQHPRLTRLPGVVAVESRRGGRTYPIRSSGALSGGHGCADPRASGGLSIRQGA